MVYISINAAQHNNEQIMKLAASKMQKEHDDDTEEAFLMVTRISIPLREGEVITKAPIYF